jgi:hypothetical protein
MFQNLNFQKWKKKQKKASDTVTRNAIHVINCVIILCNVFCVINVLKKKQCLETNFVHKIVVGKTRCMIYTFMWTWNSRKIVVKKNHAKALFWEFINCFVTT